MALANERFLNKIFVDKNIKQLVEAELLWEKYLPKQAVDAISVLYYKETYFDIVGPNDSALSKTMDPKGRMAFYRAEGSGFAHTDYSPPTEYNLRLYRLGLEVDFTDDEKKFATLENRILKKQEKLANYFSGQINEILGNTLTETWSATPSGIQYVAVGSGDEWSIGPGDATVLPVNDVLGAMEKIEDVAGYMYKANILMLSVQSYYDLLNWLTQKNYSYTYEKLDDSKDVMKFLGLNIVKTNMVKRDFGIVADLGACGTLFETEPMNTHVYYTDKNRVTHVQAERFFNFALTDPKAVCTLVNLVA